MPIYKKDQALPVQPVIVLLIGEPGTAKTSLSNTCKNALNIDFDLGFKRSYGRPDSLQLERGWVEVLENLENGAFDNYDTVVIDTAKGCLDDFLMVYVQEKDYKLKTNKLKAFGAIGEEFKLFINILRRKGKDIFIIAHSKTEGDGDTKKVIADITGQSNQLLLRVADQVGFLSMRNNERVITFNPTDVSIGKNVAGLSDITLPLHTSDDWNGFADKKIMQPIKDSLSKQSQEQVDALNLISDWRFSIDALEVGEDPATFPAELLESYKEMLQIEPDHIKKQIAAYFTTHLAKVGFKWSAKANGFVPKEEKPADAPPATDPAPVVADNATTASEPPAEPAPVVNNLKVEPSLPTINAEDNKAAVEAQAGTNGGSVVNVNPNLAKPKDDLFAPTK